MGFEKVKVKIVNGRISIDKVYEEFYNELDDSTGTILIHHGKAKFPGKYFENYSKIELTLKDDNAQKILQNKADDIFNTYNLNKLHIYHSLGTLNKNDPILFLAVEAKDRDSAFKSVREILEFIKKDELIELKEL
ncbi:molybdenum cofactor biosynthesis protein MoaE [Calditerrivibrio nitroreducens]|uniref:Molybdopterin synthase catalytic subunit n=1 Tax=Calditerrivibrio nitroreducens (strain DSM 19672 / NBRC 101217 / Yu37-1) TaxID=768670 RepID=E4TI58_CALNY|nr:molybdenum cofactor biosynthesis protein MoaE [Calditerrivibrio nitroreducens]ADR18974.1 molybdopterin biosynthesis protein MoaE [Calditerrivibrio nitroreducens DSM 19672]